MDEWTDKQTNARRTRLYLLSRTGNSPSTSARRRARPRLPLSPLPPPQCPPKRKRPRREPSNSVTGTGGVRAPPEPLQNHPPQPEDRNECFYNC
jgi:hypothetical protein